MPSVVVVGLSGPELELFLRGRRPDFGPAAVVHWVGTDGLTPAAWAERLERLRPNVLLSGWTTPPLPEAWLGASDCPLRYVCHITGTVRRLVPRVFLERGGLVTNWGGLAARSVAEQALLLGLAALRDLPGWHRAIELPRDQRKWDTVRTRPLHGARVGLHGFGAVARALIEMLRPFQVEISAYSAGVPAALMQRAGVTAATSLIEAFRGRDIVFDCEALTPASEGTVDTAVLAALPDGAVFVNVGRGRVIDEPALVREAASGRLRVAVDVMAAEPANVDSPLCRVPGVIVSPHIGGPTVAEYPVCGDLALANVRRHLAGQPVEAALTLEMYDRAT